MNKHEAAEMFARILFSGPVVSRRLDPFVRFVAPRWFKLRKQRKKDAAVHMILTWWALGESDVQP